MRETCCLDVQRSEKIGDVVGGGLPIDSGIHREDDFFDPLFGDSLDEVGQVEIFRTDAVERRQGSAKYVIAGAQGAGALERPEIGAAFNNDEQFRIAPAVAADRARVATVDMAANRADGDAGARDRESVAERAEKFLALADEMQSGAAGRAWSEPRQARQKLDEPFDLRPANTFSHQRLSAPCCRREPCDKCK